MNTHNLNIKLSNNLCSYYQAYVLREQANYFVAIVKSFDNLAFDRTIDVEKSLFEFFVPSECEPLFLDLMHYFIDNGLVKGLTKKENRLSSPVSTV